MKRKGRIQEMKEMKGRSKTRASVLRQWKQGWLGFLILLGAFGGLSFAVHGDKEEEKLERQVITTSPEHPRNWDPQEKLKALYAQIDFQDYPRLRYEVFEKAYWGYHRLRKAEKITPSKQSFITIIDFSLHSAEPRLWLIDLEKTRVIFCDYVAHGQNSGLDFARSFSNKPSSHQSSLGFYLTDRIYQGKHGKSLRLHGLEPGINHRAFERAIVMHGADYVSESFIRGQKRLGRSWGCPAVSRELAPVLIDKIAGGTLLYIYAPDPDYLARTQLIHPPEETATRTRGALASKIDSSRFIDPSNPATF